MNLIYKEESYQIVGACFEVFKEFGNGFDEAVYHESLEVELGLRKIEYVSEPMLNVSYKGMQLKKHFRPDLVCYEKIIIELKAVKALNDFYRQQVLNYLKATGYKLGILVNFGSEKELEYERVVL